MGDTLQFYQDGLDTDALHNISVTSTGGPGHLTSVVLLTPNGTEYV